MAVLVQILHKGFILTNIIYILFIQAKLLPWALKSIGALYELGLGAAKQKFKFIFYNELG